MCPACWINGLILLVMGTSGLAIVNNPIFIFIFVALTMAGMAWMVYGNYKGGGSVKSIVKSTLLVIVSFASGYILAAYQTHEIWAPGPHHDAMDGELTETPAVLPMPSDNSVSESVKMYTDMMDRVKNLSLGIENKEK